MRSRVLVPMDDSEMAERALRYALETTPEADITVVHVVGEPSPMLAQATGLALADDIEDAARTHADSVLGKADSIAAEYNTEIETVVKMGHPAKAIVDMASDYDTIIMGSHGGSLSDRLFIGNVARRVFRHAPIPVTTVR